MVYGQKVGSLPKSMVKTYPMYHGVWSQWTHCTTICGQNLL